MGKKRNNDIIITFLGTSNSDVTGSSVLINYPKSRDSRGNILLELGLCQGGASPEKDIITNKKMLEKFPKDLVSSIDYVLVGHSHVDHIGNLSYLNETNGFKGTVYCTPESVLNIKSLCRNTVEIQNSNIQKIKFNKGKVIAPNYTLEDMEYMFNHIDTIPINEKIKLGENIEVRFKNSGHVLGGAMIELWIRKPNNSIKHIVYTSDMGSNYNNEFQAFTPLRDTIDKCNLLISEATYNDPTRSFTRKQAIQERIDLKKQIKEDLLSGRKILMSAFSFARCQTLMVMLYEFFKDEEWFNFDIVLDGKLLFEINNNYLNILEGEEYEYFKEVCSWNRFVAIKEYKRTLSHIAERKVDITISTSGFLVGGRIEEYLKYYIPCSTASIYLTGFSGDVGKRLLSKDTKTITISKSKLVKSAKVTQLKTFSSHIQFDELIKLFKGANCEKILIHHSSEEGKEQFGALVREELTKIGRSTKVDVVTKENNQFIL